MHTAVHVQSFARARLCREMSLKRGFLKPTNANANNFRWLLGSVTAHSVAGGRSSHVPWPLSRQRAYSSQSQALVLNHMFSRPHLSPRVLLFASATKALILHCLLLIYREGWKAELA